MLDTTNRGIIDVIRTLAANGESGRLQMTTGMTEGVIFFRNGQLVDARVGNLTGFQAINAAASIRDASFSFDPTVASPAFSSITPNERVVLKQFFGIETAAPEQIIADKYEEVTLETPKIEVAAPPPAPAIPYTPPSTPFYRSALILALFLILMATAAVALLYSFGERGSAPSVATNVQPSSPAATNVQPSSPAPAPVGPTEHPTYAAQDLTGKWNIVNTVQNTSYGSFKNMQIGFDLSIEQNGKGFTGKGVKISENGRSLPASNRTPIQLKGSIDGDKVEATFLEAGTLRKTNGRFVWRIDKAGRLSGTFITTAARSSGKSTAQKKQIL